MCSPSFPVASQHNTQLSGSSRPEWVFGDFNVKAETVEPDWPRDGCGGAASTTLTTTPASLVNNRLEEETTNHQKGKNKKVSLFLAFVQSHQIVTLKK